MKIALCLTGHFRTFYRTKHSWISEVEEKYKPDVFIHTWDTLGFGRPLNDIQHESQRGQWGETQKGVVDKNAEFGDSRVEFCRLSPDLEENIFTDTFSNIRDIVIEDYRDVEPEILEICKRIDLSKSPYFDYPPNFISAQRKVYLCNELKKQAEIDQGYEYDLVIKARPDLMINHLNLGPGFSESCILPSDQSYHGISDIFAVGKSGIIDKYSSFFTHVDDYIDQAQNFNPHSILAEHLKQRGVSYLQSPSICDVTLIRGR